MWRNRVGDQGTSWRGSGREAFAASVPEGADELPNVRANEAQETSFSGLRDPPCCAYFFFDSSFSSSFFFAFISLAC